MNKILLTGRLVDTPNVKVTASQKTFATFSIAVTGINDETSFFPCVAWEQKAQYIGNFYAKGDMVELEGRLSRRSYTNKEGKTAYITEIVVENINRLIKSQNHVEAANIYDSLNEQKNIQVSKTSNESQNNTEIKYNENGEGII